ncbi:MAG: hypothetical protein ABRQ38_06575 [Candidatus Eremiobacterota bacterium]
MEDTYLTPDDIRIRYSYEILVQLTDRDKTGFINDEVIQICIDDAFTTLSSLLDPTDETTYGLKNLKKWWTLLTYCALFAFNEQEKVAFDKKQSVIEEIESFKQNKSVKNERQIVTASEEILPEATILKWGKPWWLE